MLAEWLDEPIYAGPTGNSTCLIDKGEIREVMFFGEDDKLCLRGKNPQGIFGWIKKESVKIIQPDFINESEMVI